MPTVLSLGEALIDFVATCSGVSLMDCPGFIKAPGGAPANVAVALARLGVETAFLGKVGEDAFGRFLERTLAEAGVDTRFMVFDPDYHTGLAFVSLQADGERDFAFFRNPSADMLYRPDEVPDAALAECRIYHFGSITLIQEPSRAATLETLQRAHAAGAWISYDPNLRPPLWSNLETARREILAALPLADVVKISEEEAEFLYGPGSVAEQAGRVLDAGPALVAITRGGQGSYLATRGAAVDLPAFSVEVVDTTGAGDGFVAGMLRSLLQDALPPDQLHAEGLRRMGRFAGAVGALACTQKGAIPALPTLREVEALLEASAAA